MSNFFDQQLDHFRKSAFQSIDDGSSVCHHEECFLFLNSGDTRLFRRGEEWPEKEFSSEIAESVKRRSASGFMARIKINMNKSWVLPDGSKSDEKERPASLIMLIHKDVRKFWAAANVIDVVGSQIHHMKDRNGEVIPDSEYEVSTPVMSEWEEVTSDLVPQSFLEIPL